MTHFARLIRSVTPLVAVLLVTGCAMHVNHGHKPGGDHVGGGDHPGCRPGVCQPDPANPRVLVQHGFLTVDQEPLRFFKAQGPVRITWQLPAKGPYTFPANGIVVENIRGEKGQPVKEEFSCGVDKQNPQRFFCDNRNSGHGSYKYTVRVLMNGKELEPLDPVIVNQW